MIEANNEQLRLRFAAQAEEMEDQINRTRNTDYENACRNWADSYGIGAKPIPPNAVDSKVSFEKFFSLEIFETNRPVSTRTPESFLPPHLIPSPSTVGPEMKHMPGAFYFTGKSGYPPEGHTITHNGITLRFVRGFYGLQGYWVRL